MCACVCTHIVCMHAQVFGILVCGVRIHVCVFVCEQGKATFDKRFAEEVGDLQKLNLQHLRELCQVCHTLANNQDLVKTGSAQCLPSREFPLLPPRSTFSSRAAESILEKLWIRNGEYFIVPGQRNAISNTAESISMEPFRSGIRI